MGSRRTDEGVERVYEASEAWVERALRADDSLFTPGKAIWSSRWLGELHERFLGNPEALKGPDFFEKLEPLLKDSPAEVHHLMGEVVYVTYLIASRNALGGEKKKQRIEHLLAGAPSSVAIPNDLVDGLAPGIAHPGQAFISALKFQLGFVIEFVEQWKEQESNERDRLLDDPWAFKKFMNNLSFQSALMRESHTWPSTQREAVLHLVFPDTFEAIVSVRHKEAIAKAFADPTTEPTDDVDRQLEQVRPALEAKYGSTGNHLFYGVPAVRSQWDSKYKPDLWDKFVRRAREYVDTGKLESEEIEYKVGIGRKLAEGLEAVLAGADGWTDLLKGALNRNEANFVSWRLISDLNKWFVEHPDEALTALEAIWTRDDYSVAERIRHFSDRLPRSVVSGTGSRTNLASALLMGLDVEQYPPFRVRLFNQTYGSTGYGQPERGADEAALYEHALGFLDRFIEEAAERGVTLRHRLDAQSVVWGMRNDGEGGEIDDKDDDDDPPFPLSDPWALPNIEALAGELRWETRELQKIVDGLKDKRQAIFQGPPGTGKTYVAKRIAEWCRKHGGDFQIVQLHPSYSYEDFVEGFRPTLDGGQAGFKLTEGPLRRIAEKAKANPDATFILVIDEINRGNVAKVLGELYFLLEYRDEPVRLQYSNEPFSLPKNLWFIGTMNTTDRSIALVDAALRRRFYFFGFFPDEPPVKGLLDRWLEENSPEAKWVAGLVELANRKLEDRHLGIGPSHFMKKDPPLDENRVRFIWEQAVIPYIEEQCFGDEGKLKEFAYDRLKGGIDGTAPGPDAGSGQPEGAADAGNGQPEDDVGDASA